jgi:hypothetical protein
MPVTRSVPVTATLPGGGDSPLSAFPREIKGRPERHGPVVEREDAIGVFKVSPES